MLRSTVLGPRDGFERAFSSLGPAEASSGLLLLLGAAAGSSTALLWLKVGALLGARRICEPRFLTGYVIGALVLGALVGLAAMGIWGLLAGRAARAVGGEPFGAARARLIWGASSLPHLIVLFVLLPLDLLIVGSSTFTTEPLRSPAHTIWSALSIAVALSILVWDLWIVHRGFQAGAGVGTTRAFAGPISAALSFVVVIGAVVGLAQLLPEGSSCPMPSQ